MLVLQRVLGDFISNFSAVFGGDTCLRLAANGNWIQPESCFLPRVWVKEAALGLVAWIPRGYTSTGDKVFVKTVLSVLAEDQLPVTVTTRREALESPW